MSFEDIKREIEKEKYNPLPTARVMNNQEKTLAIKEFNNRPEVKGNNIKAVTNGYTKLLWAVIIILLGLLIVFSYRTYYPEKFKDNFSNNINLSCQECPDIPACPSPTCNNNCPDLSFPSTINMRIINST